jgi:hypothetical protein
VLHIGLHEERLAGLDVGAGADDELCVLLEAGIHAPETIGLNNPPFGRSKFKTGSFSLAAAP